MAVGHRVVEQLEVTSSTSEDSSWVSFSSFFFNSTCPVLMADFILSNCFASCRGATWQPQGKIERETGDKWLYGPGVIFRNDFNGTWAVVVQGSEPPHPTSKVPSSMKQGNEPLRRLMLQT